jgi:hypothetical protein
MTDYEWRKELYKRMPSPENARQEKLYWMVRNINRELCQHGSASVFEGRGLGPGNREFVLSVGREVEQMYLEKGYDVQFYEYSKNNKDSYFWMKIKVKG